MERLSDRTKSPLSCSRSPSTAIPPCDGDCSISSVVFVEGGGGGAAAVENSIITVLPSKKDRTECGNYRGIALLAHAGKILLKIISCCFSEFGVGVGILPEEQRSFQNRSTTDVLFLIRRLQELARKKRITLHVCFIEHTTTQGGVDRTILWTVLPFLALYKVWYRSLMNSIMACKHVCGSMTECPRGDWL